jgi:hypothetical protein
VRISEESKNAKEVSSRGGIMALIVGASPVCTMNLVNSAPEVVSTTAILFPFPITDHVFLRVNSHERVRR